MENNSNIDQLPEEGESSQNQNGTQTGHTAGAESTEQQKNDQEFINKVQQDQPDALEKPEAGGHLVGDVDPTTRVDISQEEQNGNSQSQSEASKISGEQL
jgi:hypothetical protein